MREAETDSHEGKRKAESLWPIFKIHHQVQKILNYKLYFSPNRVKTANLNIFENNYFLACKKSLIITDVVKNL